MIKEIFEDFQKAIDRLEEVLDLEENRIVRDSAIKRFELCFDLAWKSAKEAAKGRGKECYSPKDCFRIAYQLGLIDYDQIWTDEMIKARNRTVHTYNEDLAEKIYSQLPTFLEAFKKLSENLKKQE